MFSTILSFGAFLAFAAAAPPAAPARPVAGRSQYPQLPRRSGNGSVSCPAGFRNVVFNAPAPQEPGWPNRFDFIQGFGVSDWIGFTIDQNSQADAVMNAGQIRVVVTNASMATAQSLVSSASPPPYIEVLNEPDAGYYGQTVLTPQEAAGMAQTLLTTKTSTKFISPAPAFPGTTWLPEFFGNCTGCLDSVTAVAAHIYDKDPQGAIAKIQSVHDQFKNKPLWLTEVSPTSDASQGCQLDSGGVINWMNTVLQFAAGTGYVEKVFWNNGEYGAIYQDNPTLCNPSLTNNDGSATALLENYGKLCA